MAHHEPFKVLGPIKWDDHNDNDNTPASLLATTFSNAQILIDSIPAPEPPKKLLPSPVPGRARSQTDSAVPPASVVHHALSSSLSESSEKGIERRENVAEQLRKEWKDVRVADSGNPLGIRVHKLATRDGKGSWFARRSVHRGVSFEKWRLGLMREFAETAAVGAVSGTGTGTGAGNGGKSVRGIGAERRVVRRVVEGVGVMEVFLVSVRFPGPTTPRDFVPLLLMPDEEAFKQKGRRTPRQFMLVSRPCEHPDVPPRSGFIRGRYESVELIREIPVEKPLRRTRSSIDLSRDGVTNGPGSDGEKLGREAMLRAAAKRAAAEGGPSRTATSSPGAAGDGDDETEMAVEWLMVTRSDPGGSVPRFMVEKGTPGGIINDAGRFIDWIESKDMEDLVAAVDAGMDDLDEQEREIMSPGTARVSLDGGQTSPTATSHRPARVSLDGGSNRTQATDVPPPSGFYGMIASALEAAGSVVMSTMSSIAGSTKTDSEQDDHYVDSDSDSEASDLDYASAEEGEDDSLAASALGDIKNNLSIPDLNSSARSVTSANSTALSDTSQIAKTVTASSKGATEDKELRRLQDRRRRAQEKMERAQEKLASKQDPKDRVKDKDRDREAQEAALAKLREKHERETAKQEEKYQRDLQRLRDKREAERKKAEERRRKAVEREERQNLQMELDKARAERDVALREIEILRDQVGALQAQNTMLVARLGKSGSAASLEGL